MSRRRQRRRPRSGHRATARAGARTCRFAHDSLPDLHGRLGGHRIGRGLRARRGPAPL